MVERGLVDRVRVPDDRRLVLVALSDHGRQMLDHADVLRSHLLESVLRPPDADQLLRVAGAMADIRQAIQAAIDAGELPSEPHARPQPPTAPPPQATQAAIDPGELPSEPHARPQPTRATA